MGSTTPWVNVGAEAYTAIVFFVIALSTRHRSMPMVAGSRSVFTCFTLHMMRTEREIAQGQSTKIRIRLERKVVNGVWWAGRYSALFDRRYDSEYAKKKSTTDPRYWQALVSAG